MRRAIATLLVALFSLSLLTPLLMAEARQPLPTCCRRAGAHRCAMGDAPSDSPTLAARCPSFSHSVPLSTVQQSAAGVPPARHLAALFSSAFAPAAPSAVRSTSLPGETRKRGPPSFLE